MKTKAHATDGEEMFEVRVQLTGREYDRVGALAGLLHRGPDWVLKKAFKLYEKKILRQEGHKHVQQLKQAKKAVKEARVEVAVSSEKHRLRPVKSAE